ncbi:MAG: hypothetical protein R6X02_35220 [Enhygromyxa sp.]
MSAGRFWEETHHWFNPFEPVSLEQPQLHAQRDPRYNPILKLERELRLTNDFSRFLLTGTIGNGKTSELNYFASRLTEHRIVVLIDLWAHIQSNVRDENALDHLEMWELLGLIGVAVHQAGTERFGHRWTGQTEQLQRALEKLREAEEVGGGAEIDVVELGRGMSVAAGGLVGAAFGGAVGAAVGGVIGEAGVAAAETLARTVADASKWTWKVGLPGTKRRDDQDSDVRRLLNAVNDLLGALQQAYGRRLLLVLDGLDRIRAPKRTQALFVDSRLLGNLECDQLITVPLMLMRRQGQNVEHFTVKDLHNIPVLRRDAPLDSARPGPGLNFFRELVAKRVAWIGEQLAAQGVTAPADPLPETAVNRLAYYSGGLARDFIKLVRLAALEALDQGVDRVDDDIVDRVLREAREDKEYFMSSREIALPETVMNDPDHRLPDDGPALELLVQRRLLAYPNETTWYFPHPLLTLALLKPRGGSSA